MRLVLLMIVLVLWNSMPLQAQTSGPLITLELKNRPLLEAMESVTNQTGLYFSYSPQAIPTNSPVSCSIRERPLPEALDLLFHPLHIRWARLENQLVLRPGPAAGSQTNGSLSPQSPRYTINGYVKEKGTGEALIGANIIAETGTGTTTNSYGFYSLELPGGTQTIRYSFLGFAEVVQHLALGADTGLVVELEESSRGMREVVISARDDEQLPAVSQPGDFNFTGAALEKLPGFAGEEDVLKALPLLPGIRSFGDGSALFYVRGGNNDQNLLLVDDAPIYNASHLFGFFSVLTPDAVNDMEVYKGDFPAKYGGRASSVIDITAREGNMNRFSFGGNLSPYASSLTLEGPIAREKASFIVSGRLSTLNWLNYLMDNNGSFNLYFYDINAKVNVIPSKRDRLFLTFYTGKDEFSRFTSSAYRTYGISWDNLAGTLRWTHLFGSKLFANTTLSLSRYNYFLYLSANRKEYWNSSISNITLKTDLTWYLNSWNTLRGGVSVTRYRSNPGNVVETGNDEQLEKRKVPEYHAWEYTFYLSDNQKIGRLLTLEYGIRLPVWVDVGPTTVYSFDANHQVIDTLKVQKQRYYDLFVSPEPRISAGIALNTRSSLKASYSRTTQFMQLLSNATGPFTSLEVWAPAGPNIPPLKADQITLGYFLKFHDGRFHFTAEGFYKQFTNHLDYADHADLLYNPLLEGELRFGDAWSYGLELMLRKPAGKLSGWIGYTWSRAWVKTPEINGGEAYPALYDSPNNLSLFLCYDTRKHWSFSASWIYLNGTPTTSPTGFFLYNGYTVPVYGEKNNQRLPDYHRLDLSVNYRINRPGNRFRHSIELTLYNAYGRANPFSVSFNKYSNDQGAFVVPADLDGHYERVPTMISVAGIIPSLNYQFTF